MYLFYSTLGVLTKGWDLPCAAKDTTLEMIGNDG